ncbi:tetratricopeptide repeat protein [Halomonas ramblicola]|uniref:tetratricopeptide repeat protein n=1 Tax=Halomonas ramblicola TaxID=747349 RepID=UPI0025B4430E|nr:tetratricopeptide repeat protein [Halomonas ramblicola]MDN3522451.1 tetratricopeptide repeat protein [Halomonas ramblicola]
MASATRPAFPARRHRLAALALVPLIAGCQALTAGDAAPERMDDPLAGAPPIERGLDAEGLAGLLGAELAGQRGDYRRAAEGYLAATQRYPSPTLAERAALAASFGGEHELLERAADRWQALAPGAEAPSRLLASLAMQRGDWPEALRQRLAQVRRGGDSDLTAFAESALAEEADPRPLLTLLREHLATAPKDARRHDAELATALLEVAAGETAAAERRLDRLGARAPELPALWLTRARLAQEDGDHAAARDAARRGLAVSPGDARFILLLAQSELRLGNVAAAEAQTDGLLEEHAGNAQLHLALARLYLDEGHPEPARRLLLPLVEEAEAPPEAFFVLGDIARAEGEVDNALLYYRQVPSGEAFLAARLRAARMLVEDDRLADARTFLRIERQRHEAYYGDLVTLEVELLDEEGRSAEADALLDRELARTPNDESLLYLRAMRAWEDGDLDGMERDLGRIIEHDPDNAMALNALGYTLADQGPEERLDDARELIERAHELDPDNPAILDSLGWVRYRQGDPEAALPWLERAYAAMPDQEIAAHLAEVLWALERRDEARALIREARERFDDRPLVDALLERIPELTPDESSANHETSP